MRPSRVGHGKRRWGYTPEPQKESQRPRCPGIRTWVIWRAEMPKRRPCQTSKIGKCAVLSQNSVYCTREKPESFGLSACAMFWRNFPWFGLRPPFWRLCFMLRAPCLICHQHPDFSQKSVVFHFESTPLAQCLVFLSGIQRHLGLHGPMM